MKSIVKFSLWWYSKFTGLCTMPKRVIGCRDRGDRYYKVSSTRCLGFHGRAQASLQSIVSRHEVLSVPKEAARHIKDAPGLRRHGKHSRRQYTRGLRSIIPDSRIILANQRWKRMHCPAFSNFREIITQWYSSQFRHFANGYSIDSLIFYLQRKKGAYMLPRAMPRIVPLTISARPAKKPSSLWWIAISREKMDISWFTLPPLPFGAILKMF